MSVKTDDRAALLRLLEEAVPAGDYDYIDEVVDPDVVLPEMPGGGQGREGYKAGIRAYGAGVTYDSVVAEDALAEGDKIAVRLVVKGRHTGELIGIPATGKHFRIEQVIIAQFRDGRVVRFWNVADRFSLLQQLRGEAAANRAAVLRFYEALNTHDADEIDRAAEEFAAQDVQLHTSMAYGATGIQGLKQGMLMLRRAFPDLHLDLQDVIADGDRVVTRVVVTGTHEDEHMGVAPTGRSFEIDEVAIFRFADRRAVEIWGVVDVYSQMRQLGAIPA